MREVPIASVCSTTSNIKWTEIGKEYVFKYIDLTSVSREELAITDPQDITKENAPSRAQRVVIKDDVIFATTRPTLRRLCIIPEQYNKQICSTGFCVLRPQKELITSRWLFLALQTDKFYNYIEKRQKGASYPAVTDSDVKEFSIPLPSLTEQHRIVDILDAEFAKIDALKANAEQNLQNAQDLFQAALKKELEPKEGWETKHLNELASFSIGLTYKPENVQPCGTIVLRSSNIQNDELTLEDIVRVDCQIKEELYVQQGDILMCSRNGSKRLVGKVALIKDTSERMTYGTFMTIIKSEFNPLLFYFFKSNSFRQQLEGGENPMINQITKYMLNDIIVSVPKEKNEAIRIAKTLDNLNNKCKSLQDIYTQTLTLCDDLKQALLRKAFNGEL